MQNMVSRQMVWRALLYYAYVCAILFMYLILQRIFLFGVLSFSVAFNSSRNHLCICGILFTI